MALRLTAAPEVLEGEEMEEEEMEECHHLLPF